MYLFPLVILKTTAAKPITTIGATHPQQKAEPQAPHASPISSSEVFSCPREGCVRVFQRYSNLENTYPLKNVASMLNGTP